MNASKSPLAFVAGGLGYILRSLWPSTSDHGNPPAWRFHDGGAGGDGGGSASKEKLRESALRVKFGLNPLRFHSFRAHFISFAGRLLEPFQSSFLLLQVIDGAAKAVPHFKAFRGALHRARGLMAKADGFRFALLPLFEVDL
jgi:hypothetical protein